MERNISQFTVLFQPPFWVGIAERWSQDGYQAARVVFGAEPTDAQLYQWLQREWPRLPFGPVLPETAPRPALANPKRMQREAAKATQPKGLGTKAQEALAVSGRPLVWSDRPAGPPKNGRHRRNASGSVRKKSAKAARALSPRRFILSNQITPASTRANTTKVASRARENSTKPALIFLAWVL